MGREERCRPCGLHVFVDGKPSLKMRFVLRQLDLFVVLD
jgi:hypothetical protein